MKSRIHLGVAAALVLLSLISVACGAAPSPTATPVPATPTAESLQVTDDLSKTVTLGKVPEKIVSLAPNVTEILFAIGAGDKVVGVSDFTTYPPEATAIPSVGGYPLNFELIASMQPDLCIGADITSADDIAKLEELGLKVVIVNKTDLDGIFSDIELVGRATGKQAEATALADSLRSQLESLKAELKAAQSQPRVFVEIDETLYTVAPGSFIDPLIQIAGGQNIASDSDNPYPQLSAEQVIAKDPEVIVLADAAYGTTPEKVMARPGWDQISAVKNGAIYPIDGDIISRPGPRILEGLQTLAGLIHPELGK